MKKVNVFSKRGFVCSFEYETIQSFPDSTKFFVGERLVAHIPNSFIMIFSE